MMTLFSFNESCQYRSLNLPRTNDKSYKLSMIINNTKKTASLKCMGSNKNKTIICNQ